MSVQLIRKANISEIEEVQMEDSKELNYTPGSSSNNSTCSLESGKDPPPESNDDTINSGTSLSHNLYPLNVILRKDNSPPTNAGQNLANNLRVTSFISPYKGNIDVSPTKESVSLNGLYNIDATTEMDEEEKNRLFKTNMVGIYSCIYGIFLTIMGAVLYINHQSPEARHICELFSICISVVGMLWLIFLHFDLYRYKKKVFKNIMNTAEQTNNTYRNAFESTPSLEENIIPPYSFLRGRHSGSFYLKTGLAAFCFGHLINEGLLLGQEIINFMQSDRIELGCGDPYSMVHHFIRPLYSFYQLFIVFKYSNIIINRYKGLACFALMHIMATCMCFWFGTIVEDALEDYYHKLDQNVNKTAQHSPSNIFYHGTSDHLICSDLANSSACVCSLTAILSVNNVQAIPYLYPFTIEFNILLAGVWFIVWHNIGKQDHKANPHHFHHKIHHNDGIEEITYQSNVVISADCHASNKGLFAGMFILMASIISIIIFFVAMSIEMYEEFALTIHYVQEGTLTFMALFGVLLAYKKLSELDYNRHPTHFLDDLLLFVPIPFFFMQALLVIISEIQKESVVRILMSALIPMQVILQTPIIIDGLRRCSNSQTLRYKKPGREIVTFLIICNLTMWIINTFEAKSVESHYGQHVYFGKFVWMFINHTTLPLMLFYRFHSSACLADIWKTAYEKGE